MKKFIFLSLVWLIVCPLHAADVPGTLDTSFNLTGTATVTVGSTSRANDISIQKDGTIILVGESASLGIFVALAQLSVDGSLIGTTTASFSSGNNSVGFGVALQQDGKIVVTGRESFGMGSNSVVGVARFNQNGSLDESFGFLGTTTTSMDDYAKSSIGTKVAIQSDNKIVIAGHMIESLPTIFLGAARFKTDGALDTSFNTGGNIPGTVVVRDCTIRGDVNVALQHDNKIVLAAMGSGADVGSIIVVRLQDDGSLDETFGGDGIVKIPDMAFQLSLGSNIGLFIQGDGKIVVAGNTSVEGVSNLAVARLNPGGALDDTFNGIGRVSTAIGNLQRSSASSVIVQPNGKIVAVGFSGPMGNSFFGVACFNPDGTLDTLFNPNGNQPGTAMIEIGSSSQAAGVALQVDGKIVLAGQSSVDEGLRMAVARLFGDNMPIGGNDLFTQRLIEKYSSRV